MVEHVPDLVALERSGAYRGSYHVLHGKLSPIQGIGPDLQTPAITYDGKYVLTPFSGFQRQSTGISVIDTSTDTLIGILPSTFFGA